MTTLKKYTVSETVTFTKIIEANSKDEATNMFIESMNDLVFGEACMGFRDISEGVKIKETLWIQNTKI